MRVTKTGMRSNKCNHDYDCYDASGLGARLKVLIWRSSKCRQYDFASSQAGNLRKHLKTHTGEKLNKCNKCELAFSQAGNLRRHLQKHSGEKSNKYNQCGFASSYSSVSRTHLKTHTGEKPNECNQCDYASCYASALRTHLKTHSGEKWQKQPVWLCIISGRPFEDTFEKAQWRKANKMQEML